MKGPTGEPASPPQPLTDLSGNKNLETLTTQPQLMTWERDQLRRSWNSITVGDSVDGRPYDRLNPEDERLKMECMRIMADLQTLRKEQASTSEKFKVLSGRTAFLSLKYRCLLNERTQLKAKVEMERQEMRTLLREQSMLGKSLKDRRRRIEADQKKENDRREAYLQLLLQKEKELTQKRDKIFWLQQYFATVRERFQKLMQELDEVKAENENLFMEVERLKLAGESKRASRK